MGFLIENVRLRELVAIVNENRAFYDDFVVFLIEEGYGGVHEFINETSDEKALEVLTRYLSRRNDVTLYDGLDDERVHLENGGRLV